MRPRWIALLAVVTLSVPTSAAGLTSAPSQSASAAAAEQKLVKRTDVIGRTAQGRPIIAQAKYWTNVRITKVVLVLGQMHGNEKAGRRTALWLYNYQSVPKGTVLWLIPSMNPDGNAANRRTNARGVDLNRNWPTGGWTSRGKGSVTWGGPKPKSEPETRAMLSFLDRKRPDYIVSIHQPYGVVARVDKDLPFEKALAKNLGLKLEPVGVGTPAGKTSPTLTGWYNAARGKYGTAVTVEYRSNPSNAWSGKHASVAISRATGIR